MKKLLSLLLAIIMIFSLVACNKTPEPKPTETIEPELTIPIETNPIETEPVETKPEKGSWYLSKLEEPNFYDVRPNEYEKDGVAFTSTRFFSPHLSINEMHDLFETNEFLKNNMKKNKLQGIAERWNNDTFYVMYDDNGMRDYSNKFSLQCDDKLVGISPNGEAITITCRTTYPLFDNNDIIMVECSNMPLKTYHKYVNSILSDMFGSEIAEYLIYAADKDGTIETVTGYMGETYNEEQSMSESFYSDETEIKLVRTIYDDNKVSFKVQYIPVNVESHRVFFSSDNTYESWYNEDIDYSFTKIFQSLKYSNTMTNTQDAFVDYFNLNTTKNTTESNVMFWTTIHEPSVENNEQLIYATAVEEKDSDYPDILNILTTTNFDKNGKVSSASWLSQGWTYFEIKDGTSPEEALNNAIALVEKQIEYVYNTDVQLQYNGNESPEEMVVVQIIDYTHPLCDKPMQLKVEWVVSPATSGAVFIFWKTTAETVS